MNFEEFIKTKQDQKPHDTEHPKGFKPGVEFNGNKGHITTKGIAPVIGRGSPFYGGLLGGNYQDANFLGMNRR